MAGGPAAHDEAAANVGAGWSRARSAREGPEGPVVVVNGEVGAARRAAAIQTRPARGGGGKVTFKRRPAGNYVKSGARGDGAVRRAGRGVSGG
eukprot:CAMPEP_0119523266 /NCGR_PEP_ID=MMETSP1344-20130328/38361_1 /TAXON_ID=236787 /ORGANISM="Florenciella parvula, Strain CCMP2471" /LENGTH=92 /DNA_ID=CAMNT_0007561449 /DNA_START=430 /DNA_END=704 /DNA_ORIENTATION=-